MIVDGGKSSGTSGEEKNYQRCEGGAYVGRCIRIVDMGTHVMPYRDKETGAEVTKHEIQVTFELGSELMEDGKPFVVSWTGTPSINEKSNLHKMLVAWRGKPFTPDELKSFDLNLILDKCCLVNVTKTPSKDGKKFYNNVQSVMQLPKGMPTADRVNDLVTFDLSTDLGNEEKLNKLWPFEKKKVMTSNEGMAYFSGVPNSSVTQNSEPSVEDLPFN